MEIIPFLIFGYVAFQIFKGFTKASGGNSTGSAKSMMQNLHAQIEKANAAQNSTPNMSRYREQSPTQRGRERLERKNQNSPWESGGHGSNLSPGAQVAANYLKQTKASRKASHKSPVQRGRRGKNMDQNRNRTDGWGERGDSSFFNGKTIVIFLVIGGAVLYGLSQMPAN